jgi:hypothetical protein
MVAWVLDRLKQALGCAFPPNDKGQSILPKFTFMTNGDAAFPEAIVKVFGDGVFLRRFPYLMGKNLRDKMSRHCSGRTAEAAEQLVIEGLTGWRKLAFWTNEELFDAEVAPSLLDPADLPAERYVPDPDSALLWGTKCQPIRQLLLPGFASSWMAEDVPAGVGTVSLSQVVYFHAALKQYDLGRLSLLELVTLILRY